MQIHVQLAKAQLCMYTITEDVISYIQYTRTEEVLIYTLGISMNAYYFDAVIFGIFGL